MKILMAVSIFSLFIACQPVNQQTKHNIPGKLKQIGWMIGKWELQAPEGTLIEEWLQRSDTQWQGISFLIKPNGDTSFAEHIRLNYQNGRLYYIPSISNQNVGKEISFVEKSFTDSLIVFENQHHDFPQRIVYKKISDTSILAAVEGIQNGQSREEEFTYTKK